MVAQRHSRRWATIHTALFQRLVTPANCHRELPPPPPPVLLLAAKTESRQARRKSISNGDPFYQLRELALLSALRDVQSYSTWCHMPVHVHTSFKA